MNTRGNKSANGSETMVIQDQRSEGKGGVRNGADALTVLCTRAGILGAAGIRGRLGQPLCCLAQAATLSVAVLEAEGTTNEAEGPSECPKSTTLQGMTKRA